MMPANDKFLIGHWLFDPMANTLSHTIATDQLEIKLDHKVAEVLQYLIAEQGKVVTRDELLDNLWPNQVIADDVLNVAISSLRKALGDKPKQPDFIKTIPRKGYQLISHVEKLEQEIKTNAKVNKNAQSEIINKDKSADENPPQKKANSNNNRFSRFTYIVVLVALFSFALFYMNNKSNDDNSKIKLAVLPFDYYSSIGDKEYLADGLTEALINRLVQEKNFSITSRTSVMQYKTNKPAIAEVVEQLNVDWILEGSVQIENDYIQVTAQLIDGHDDTHVWSETYQQKLTDLFAIQADISDKIAARFTVNSVKPSKTKKIPAAAYDAYLQAKYLAHQGKTQESISQYKQAIKLHPKYAQAIAGLAHHSFLSAFNQPDKAISAIDEGSKLALKAAAINTKPASVQLVLALHYLYQLYDYQLAGIAFEQAYQSNNQDLMILEWYVQYLFASNQLVKAQEISTHMMAVSPLAYNKTTQFFSYYYQEDYSNTLKELAKKESFISAAYFQSLHLWTALAMHDETAFFSHLPKFLSAFKTSSDNSKKINDKCLAQDLASCLRSLITELPDLSLYDQAELNAWAGEKRVAIDLLKQLVDKNALSVIKIAIEPSFYSLKNEPEFQALLTKLKLK